MSEPAPDPVPTGDAGGHRDELPSDLNAAGYVGPYKFPDNSRRRIPGVIYLAIAALAFTAWLATRHSDPVLINEGFAWAALGLALAGVYCITSGWRMHIDETDALVAATKQVAFPVGHASAQLAWRGLRSRPTWRILCYSAEEPPLQRGFVMVDAIDGRVVDAVVQDNPEDWSDVPRSRPVKDA
jgi:hypothetical protein